MVRLQEALAATLRPQVLVEIENSAGLVPATVILAMLKAEPPVLVRIVVRDLVRVVFTMPKSKFAGTISTVPLVSVSTALADFVVSDTEVAVTLTVGDAGTATGGV
jgi:hypothetical protein